MPSGKTVLRWVVRHIFKALKFAVVSFLLAIPSVVINDSAAGILDAGGKNRSRGVTWFSALLWVSVLPLLLWNLRFISPWEPIVLLVQLPAAWFLFGRRFSADRGIEMTVRQFLSRVRDLTHSEAGLPDIDGNPGKLGRVRVSTVVQCAAAAVMAFGAVLWLSSTVPLLRSVLEPVRSLVPFAELIVLAGFWLTLPVAVVASLTHARNDEQKQNQDLIWEAQLAGVLSISVNDWYAGSGAYEFSEGQTRLAITHVPIGARSRLDGMEGRCSLIIPGWTVVSASWDRVELAVVELHPDVVAARAAMAASEGLVVAFLDLPDSPIRPSAALWKLRRDGRVTAAQVDALAVSQGLRLVDLREDRHEAVVARLSSRVQQVRRRLAGLLGKPEHDIELLIKTVGGRIDTVDVVRSPNLGADAEKRTQLWRNLIEAIEGGNNGWAISDDAVTGRVLLTYGEPRALPPMVSMEELLPERAAPEEWATLPLGVDETGCVVSIDLTAGPHSLIAGPTGSGKTVALLELITSAIAHGHQVVLIDPTKNGLDFLSIRPWTVAWATESLEAAQAAMERVYAEVGRRKAILVRESEVKWSDLSDAVRQAENIHPVLVVVDELGSLVLLEDVPKGLPKTDPYVVDAETRNAARSIIRTLIGRVAREARFAGIHLAVALQRPDAAILGGELRSNLTSAVQLAPPGKPISREAMTMLIPGEQGPLASEALAALDDGKSRGLAVIASDGGSVTGFRVAYAPAKSIPALLEKIGIPKPAQWAIGAVARPAAVLPEPETVILSPTVTEDLGVLEVDFDFGAFDEPEQPIPATSVPAASVPAPPAQPTGSAFSFSFDD